MVSGFFFVIFLYWSCLQSDKRFGRVKALLKNHNGTLIEQIFNLLIDDLFLWRIYYDKRSNL